MTTEQIMHHHWRLYMEQSQMSDVAYDAILSLSFICSRIPFE